MPVFRLNPPSPPAADSADEKNGLISRCAASEILVRDFTLGLIPFIFQTMIKSKWNSPPLLSWDLAQEGFHKFTDRERIPKDLETLYGFGAQFEWALSPVVFRQIAYDALVLTSAAGAICWVSDGFYEMTGYTAREAMGKNPSFLQGAGTADAVRAEIRKGLNDERPVTHTLVNYRKNGESYHCEIRIIPIRDRHDQLTHFLAFEREVA